MFRAALAILVLVVSSTGAAQSNPSALIAEGSRLLTPAVSQPGRAVGVFEQAVRIAEQQGDTAALARALTGLAEAFWLSDRFDRALATADRAYPLVQATGDLRLEAELLRHRATALIMTAQFDRAVEDLERSLDRARRGGASDAETRALNNLSVIAIRRGRLPSAVEYARAAVAALDAGLAKDEPISPRAAFSAPYNLGKSLADSGDPLEAARHFDRAFRTALQNHDIGGQHHVLFDTAEWYLAQGDLGRAERYYTRSLEHADKMPGVESRAKSLRGLASLDVLQGHPQRAAGRYEEALRLFERGQYQVELPPTLVALARARRLAGELDAARQGAEEAERQARRIGHAPALVLARLELARHARASKNLGSAKALASDAVRLAEEGGLRPAAIAALVERAEIARDENATDEAIADYRRAIALIDRTRGRIAVPDLRATFAEASHAAYEGLVDTLLAAHVRAPGAGFDRQALLALEEERAHNLVDALNGAFADRSREVPSAQRARRQQLDAQLGALQFALQRDTLPAADRIRLQRELDDAERDLVVLEASASAARQAASATRPDSGQPDDLGSRQRGLPPEEAILHYVQRQHRGWVYIITAQRIALARLDLPADLDDRLALFRALLAGGQGRDALVAGRELTRVLIQPLAPYVPSTVSRLIISATGSLAGLPWAALPVAGDVPLVGKYEIAMNPSLGALSRVRERRPDKARRGVLAFGAPATDAGATIGEGGPALPALPASVREAQRAADAVTDSTLHLGTAASEAVFRAPSGLDYRVIHFASHALLDEEVPERSALLLAPAAGLDGLLQPREIFGLEMAADLIVLGACETAAGRSSRAEGLQSLARAFLYAGSRSVVGTLWAIGDNATADLMQRFYDELTDGWPVGAAMRRAQLAMAGRDPYRTAQHWAGYVVAGDPLANPQLRSAGWSPRAPVMNWMVTGLVLIALVGMTVWWQARQRSQGNG